MKVILSAVGGVLLVAFLAVFGALASTLGGAFTGWIVGYFFDDTLGILTNRLGLYQIEFWQLGAILGFVGSFFKATTVKSSD